MSMFSAEYPHPKFQFIVIMCIKVALCIDRVPIWLEKVSKWVGEPNYLVYSAHIHVFAMVEFYPDRRIAVSTGRAPVSCLKPIFQGEITQLCLSPSQKVRGTLYRVSSHSQSENMCVSSWVSEQVSKEHSQSLIKVIINALIAEKPERTGLLTSHKNNKLGQQRNWLSTAT